jgi:hypothetical protein
MLEEHAELNCGNPQRYFSAWPAIAARFIGFFHDEKRLTDFVEVSWTKNDNEYGLFFE